MEDKENGIVLNEKGADGTENDESRTNDPNQPQQQSGDDKVKKFDDVNVLGSSNSEQGAKCSSTLSYNSSKYISGQSDYRIRSIKCLSSDANLFLIS
jgi:hypothetical protein